MKILRAQHRGMCFGVRDAIALATERSAAAKVTVLGDLVHNEHVLSDLKRRGVQFKRDPREVETKDVMITAHGASESAIDSIRKLGLNVIEATCPLVRYAHTAIGKLADDGFHPVIIGKPDHVEVRGLTGDLEDFDVIQSESDITKLQERPRFGVAAQTTQPLARVQAIYQALRARFPNSDFRFVDTVCGPTKQRQAAADEIAREADVVIVIGGANSNNTRELVATCQRHCERVHHVQQPGDLQREWLFGADIVGVTAGTSTPDPLIKEIEEALLSMSPDQRPLVDKALSAIPAMAGALSK